MCDNIENKYKPENVTVSHGERLNSPFYPLISTLRKYSHHQATMHDMAKVLDRTLNTITDQLEEMEENVVEPAFKLEKIDILETMGGIILELIREVYLDERVEHVEEFIELISNYDRAFLNNRRNASMGDENEGNQNETLSCSIFEILPAIDKFYTFLEELKDLTEKYTSGLTDERKFLERTGFIKKYILETAGELENKFVNAREWGIEASPGDNLLMESLDDWKKSFDYFLDIFSTDFREQFKRGMSLANEGSQKMAMINFKINDSNKGK